MMPWTTFPLALALTLAAATPIRAGEDSTPAQDRALNPAVVTAFWAQVPLATEQDLKMLGNWRTTTLSYVSATNIYTPTFEQFRPLLEDAVTQGMSSLEFFSDPAWRGPKAALLSQKLLFELRDNFKMRALFRIKTTDVEGQTVQTEWSILGNAQMLIKYDRACKIFHPDYHFYTGKYDYRVFFRMHVGLDKAGARGVFRIKGADRPGDKLEYLTGPVDAAIKNFVIVGRTQLRCDYEKLWMDNDKLVSLLPIERMPPKESQNPAPPDGAETKQG